MTRPSAAAFTAFALVLAQIVFVAAYIGSEHTIYFWDHAMYFGMAREIYEIFSANFTIGLGAFKDSLANNYNFIFALPSCLTFPLFGETRTTFILTNFFFFFLPYEIAVAFFLRWTLGFAWDRALAVSFAAAFFTPPVWLPLLEGYPDSGAAACIVCAAAVLWNGPTAKRYAKNAITAGLILGFGVLLRRHFAYPAFALLAARGALALWELRGVRKNRARIFGRIVGYFALCGAAFVALLASLAPDFLKSALTVDYTTLYLSYKRPAFEFLRFTLSGFGILLLLAAANGLVLLASANKSGRRLSVFTALFVLFWLIAWCLGPDQTGHHYMLHALPFAVAVGLAGWVTLPKKKLAGAFIMAVLLAANSAYALWLSPTGVWPNDNGRPGVFSAPRPPVVRTDYDEWLRLANYLRRTTNANDRIMIAGSSFVFNQDILHSVDTDIIGANEMLFRLPKTPEVDHEEPAPLDVFASSTVYVVPTPPQYHLDPSGQRVITAATNRFPPPKAYGFEKDEEVFHLADNVTVEIWRHKPGWSFVTLHEALAAIRHDAPQDPNYAQDWVATVMPLRAQVYTDPQNHTFVRGLFAPEQNEMRLFFDRPLEAGSYRITLALLGNCNNPKLSLGAGDDGEEWTQDMQVSGDEFSGSFTGNAQYAELDLKITTDRFCSMDMRDLRVEKTPAP